MDDIQRDIGRLEGTVSSLDKRLDGIEGKIDTLVKAVEQGRGGWKLLGSFGALSAVVSALTHLILHRGAQ